MRRFWTFSLLSIVISPIALFAQEWALEADIELAGHYEWQGLQLDPGRTIQHAVYGSLAWHLKLLRGTVAHAAESRVS